MKIAPAIPKNRMSHFAKSHLRFLKISGAIFGPIPPWCTFQLQIVLLTQQWNCTEQANRFMNFRQ
jgi:hypothetical protein